MINSKNKATDFERGSTFGLLQIGKVSREVWSSEKPEAVMASSQQCQVSYNQNNIYKFQGLLFLIIELINLLHIRDKEETM